MAVSWAVEFGIWRMGSIEVDEKVSCTLYYDVEASAVAT